MTTGEWIALAGLLATIIGGVIVSAWVLWRVVRARVDRADMEIARLGGDVKSLQDEDRHFRERCDERHGNLDTTLRRHDGHFEKLYQKIDELKDLVIESIREFRNGK